MEGFKILTNQRPVKAENKGNFLFVKSTSGQLQLSEDAAKALQVFNGDYVSVAEQNGQMFIFKGHAADQDNDQIGAKLASAKVGSVLNFSSENVWTSLGGANDKVITFELDGVEEGTESKRTTLTHPKTGRQYLGYPIHLKGDRAKMQRKPKEAVAQD